jgi:hypothetical protein
MVAIKKCSGWADWVRGASMPFPAFAGEQGYPF